MPVMNKIDERKEVNYGNLKMRSNHQQPILDSSININTVASTAVLLRLRTQE